MFAVTSILINEFTFNLYILYSISLCYSIFYITSNNKNNIVNQ